MSDKCREFLKEKIKTLSGECEEKKGMVEVLTRVDGELRGEIAEREKEVKELRPLCARKEALLRWAAAVNFCLKPNVWNQISGV